jgi:hypothetical protein
MEKGGLKHAWRWRRWGGCEREHTDFGVDVKSARRMVPSERDFIFARYCKSIHFGGFAG